MKDKLLHVYVTTAVNAHIAKNKIMRTFSNEDGASTVEYALLIGAVVIGIVGAASLMGPKLEPFFQSVVDKITNMVK